MSCWKTRHRVAARHLHSNAVARVIFFYFIFYFFKSVHGIYQLVLMHPCIWLFCSFMWCMDDLLLSAVSQSLPRHVTVQASLSTHAWCLGCLQRVNILIYLFFFFSLSRCTSSSKIECIHCICFQFILHSHILVICCCCSFSKVVCWSVLSFNWWRNLI